MKLLNKVKLLLLFLLAQHFALAQYCTPGPSSISCQSAYIAYVGIGAQINNSGCGPNSYTYYNNVVMNVAPKQTYSLAVNAAQNFTNPPAPAGTFSFGAWIDYDHNNVFDQSEFIALPSRPTPNAFSSVQFTVPETALPGETRMRISLGLNYTVSSNGACYVSPLGSEVEDYRINIQFPPCPTLQGGTLVASADSICQYQSVILSVQNSNTDLSVAGVRYQWQRSTDSINWTKDFGRISGTKDTAKMFKGDEVATFDPSWGPVYFRKVIYCGGDSAISSVARVGYATCYPCTPNPIHCAADYQITRVRLANLDNSSGCSNNNGYTNYSSIVAPVQLYKDSSFNFQVNITQPSSTNYAFIGGWIDVNHDGIFEGREATFNIQTDAGGTYYSKYPIYYNTVSGPTKMRVFYKADINATELYLGGFESCNGTYFSTGEFEDYDVYINDNPDCATVPEIATWKGYYDIYWDNPLNWRCGKVPDSNSKVIIPPNANVKIDKDISIYSLTVSPSATVTVTSGHTLTVLH